MNKTGSYFFLVPRQRKSEFVKTGQNKETQFWSAELVKKLHRI